MLYRHASAKNSYTAVTGALHLNLKLQMATYYRWPSQLPVRLVLKCPLRKLCVFVNSTSAYMLLLVFHAFLLWQRSFVWKNCSAQFPQCPQFTFCMSQWNDAMVARSSRGQRMGGASDGWWMMSSMSRWCHVHGDVIMDDFYRNSYIKKNKQKKPKDNTCQLQPTTIYEMTFHSSV